MRLFILFLVFVSVFGASKMTNLQGLTTMQHAAEGVAEMNPLECKTSLIELAMALDEAKAKKDLAEIENIVNNCEKKELTPQVARDFQTFALKQVTKASECLLKSELDKAYSDTLAAIETCWLWYHSGTNQQKLSWMVFETSKQTFWDLSEFIETMTNLFNQVFNVSETKEPVETIKSPRKSEKCVPIQKIIDLSKEIQDCIEKELI